MADNVLLNSGTGGATAAADDIGGVHHQRVKLSVGADGSASDAIPVSNGLDTTAAGVQAVGIVGQLDDASTGTVTENQFAPVRISSRRALLVEGVASGTAQPVSIAATVTVDGSGVTQPVSHAALTELAAAIDTEVQVDVVGALPAGTNNIGDVDIASALPAGNNNIGDVDVASLPSSTLAGGAKQELDYDTGAGTQTTQIIGIALPASGGPVAGGTSTNPIQVGDAGGSLTIDGTVTANLSATDNAVLDSIDAAVNGTLDVNIVSGAGSGGTAAADDADFTAGTTSGTPAMGVYESSPTNVTDGDLGTVGITQGRRLKTSTTLDAAIPAGTNNIGDVDVLSIAAGDNNIGNVDIVTMPNVTLAAGTNTNEVVGDVAHDAAVGGNPVLVAGVAQDTDDTAPPNRVSAESDATRLATNHDGALHVLTYGPQVWSYHVNGSSALTDASVHVAPGAGLSLYVTDICISLGAATALNVFFEEGSTTVLGPFYLEAVNGRSIKLEFKTPKKITANTALTVTSSAAVAHSIDVTGFTAND